ncbi:MAG: RNA methyltransferase, partial [Planctomycetales bacterium]|nr:RNA methyltransferase [Planctomycetales bacterium]
AILRTMDAVGAQGLILLNGGVDPFHPTAVRASMGALFWQRVVAARFEDFAPWTAELGYNVYGTSAHSKLSHRE